MSVDLKSYRTECLVVAMIVFIHSLRYFDYVELNPTPYGWASNIMSLLLIAFYSVYGRKARGAVASKYLLGLLFVPMLSFLPCMLENGQGPVDSLRAYLYTFLVLIYYVLHAAKVKEKPLVQAITAIALVRIAILLIQQFTYPYYWFSFRPEGVNSEGYMETIEVRSGIYRFYIEDTYLSMFLVFYYLQKLTSKFTPGNLVLFLVGLFGVYLDQSRQFMVSTLAAVIIPYVFVKKGHTRLIVTGLIVALVIFGFTFGKDLFDELVEMSMDDMSDGDNIRLMSYATFLFQYWGGPLSVIFGNGPAWGNSAYGEELTYMMEYMKLYRADVGIVGTLNLFGISTVATLVYFYISFVFKNWSKLESHIKMYFIASLVNMPLVTIYTQNINWFVFMAFMLYLSDMSIAKADYINKKRVNTDEPGIDNKGTAVSA